MTKVTFAEFLGNNFSLSVYPIKIKPFLYFMIKSMGHDKPKRDDRYDLIKPLVETGKIMFFNDIFKYIPKTVVAKDLGKKVDRFNTLMSRVQEFMLADLFIMAKKFDIGEDVIVRLVMNDYKRNKGEIENSVNLS
jgi:hypothetical protein